MERRKGATSNPTYTATVYVGLREGYDGPIHDLSEVEEAVGEFVDEVGSCVTLTATIFRYTGGREPGAAIGLIDYPRFGSSPRDVLDRASELASRMKERFRQHRVSVVCSDVTFTIGDLD